MSHFSKTVRSALLFFIGSALLGSLALAPVLAQAQNTASSQTQQQQILTLTNADRTAQHIQPVTESAALDAAAQAKVNDMLANQYFAHVSPQGITPWYWVLKSGYIYMYAGENLAMDFNDAQSVETAWMGSPTHRANILNGKYKNIGIAVVQGTYEGKPVVFIAEEFGTKQ